MTKDEMLWGNIRFLLLLIFSVAAIYIILWKLKMAYRKKRICDERILSLFD